MKQNRDAKGRFCKKQPKKERSISLSFTLILIVLFIILGFAGGRQWGYAIGYSDGNNLGYYQGSQDNQYHVWLDGFNKGQKYPNLTYAANIWNHGDEGLVYCSGYYSGECRVLNYGVDQPYQLWF